MESKDEKFDEVEINPEATRLGLNVPVSSVKLSSPLRNTTAPPIAPQTSALKIQHGTKTSNLRNAFGIEYKRIPVPGELNDEYTIPTENAEDSDSEDEFEECVVGTLRCTAGSMVDEFDTDFDQPTQIGDNSKAQETRDVTEAEHVRDERESDTDMCNPQTITRPLDPLGEDESNINPSGTNQTEPLDLNDEKESNMNLVSNEEEGVGWSLIQQGGMSKLMEMTKQYSAGLSDEEAREREEKRIEMLKKSLEMGGPLDTLVEEEEDYEEHCDESDNASNVESNWSFPPIQSSDPSGFEASKAKESFEAEYLNEKQPLFGEVSPLNGQDLNAVKKMNPSQDTSDKKSDAEKEWHDVEVRQKEQEQFAKENPGMVDWTIGPQAPFTYKVALAYHMSDESGVEDHEIEIKESSSNSIFERVFTVSLKKSLHSERKFVFLMAKFPLDFTKEQHGRIMRTIYSKLSGDYRDCSPCGKHWESIGFQGTSPTTDFRSVGMFGALQLLFFVERAPAASERIFKLSTQPSPNCFPFCAVSLNFSLLCIKVMRSGKLNRIANRQKSVLNSMHHLYLGLWLLFEAKWLEGKCTVEQYQEMESGLSKQCFGNPAKVERLGCSVLSQGNDVSLDLDQEFSDV